MARTLLSGNIPSDAMLKLPQTPGSDAALGNGTGPYITKVLC